MRIEKLRFCNLNSLTGSWEVDFTHPDYLKDGLFAITGPTGAGKTTILDAICLALYGRTPRLGLVSAGNNEIMSRRHGECWAEVTFSTHSGRYCAAWFQKRARSLPGGKLQPADRGLFRVEGENKTSLSSKVKDANKEVESITGLNFERFTRIVLLAQGGFDAFLRADEAQRAEILENLTGTAIYRDISIYVHKKNVEEKGKCKELELRLEATKLLSDEERAALRQRIAESKKQETLAKAHRDEVGKGLKWLRELAALQTEIAGLETEKKALHTKKEEFEPQREKLRRAEKARDLRPDYAKLDAEETAQLETQTQIAQIDADLIVKRQAVGVAENRLTEATTTATNARNAYADAKDSLRAAGNLDVQIAEKTTRIVEENTAIAAAEQTCATLKAAYDTHVKEHEDVQSRLAELQEEMEKYAPDKALVELLAGLEERFANVKRLHAQLETGRVSENKARIRATSAEQEHTTQRAATASAEKTETEAVAKSAAQQKWIRELLQGRELSAWRDSLARLGTACTQLEEVKGLLTLRDAAADKRKELQDAVKTIQGRVEARTLTIAAAEVALKELETQRTRLEDGYTRAQAVINLKDLRSRLRSDEACPLCGSAHHPFATGTVPDADEARSKLAEARLEYDKKHKKCETLRIGQAEDATTLKGNAAQENELSTQMQDSVTRLTTLAAAVSLDVSLPAEQIRQAVAQRLKSTEDTRVNRAKRVTCVEAAEKVVSGLQSALHSAVSAATQARLRLVTAAHNRDAAQAEVQRLATENTCSAKILEEKLRNLEADVLPFGEESVTMELLDAVLNRLKTRSVRWQSFVTRLNTLKPNFAALQESLKQEKERREADEKALHAICDLVKTHSAERDALRVTRHTLFAGPDPRAEEERLTNAAVAAEEEQKKAVTAVAEVQKNLGTLLADQARREKERAERAVRLATLGAAFTGRLQEAEFAGRADFLAAVLSDEELAQRAAEERSLADALTGLQANLSRLGQKSKELQTIAVTDKTLEEAESASRQIQDDLDTLQKQLGADEQVWQTNDQAQKSVGELLEKIGIQKATALRWSELHAHIGAHDGSAFSKFVQDITFEIMIDHANQQLQSMTERYILVSGTHTPLDLEVIDSFQAGEVRPTVNLSGGESFLVSLALALGLSRMASQNVRVDSLFMDEGFGSLDEDALQMALNALGSLRSEGKLIGIISHVPSIKDTISTQIAVTPLSGGRSTLQGAGVKKGVERTDSKQLPE